MLANLFWAMELLSAVKDDWNGDEVECIEFLSPFPSNVSDLDRTPARFETLSRGLGRMLAGRLAMDLGVFGPGMDASEFEIACLANLSLPL